jgi:hypothetical protein
MREDEDHWAQPAMSQKSCAVPAFPLRRGAAGLESVATMNLAGGRSLGGTMQLNDRFTRDVRHRSVVGPDLGPRRYLRVNGTRQGAALQIQLHGSGWGQPMLCATAALAIEAPVSRCAAREGVPEQRAGVSGGGWKEST